ncbi:MAG: flagellar biosynthesis repressor FlbT [Rhodospirillaceae bacterium]|jgi:flagellar protein FlbT|nr:flagellar biosynthesis repressor FlbT [Rhodospirillaceae bacterium]MBT4226403.1 flagellar biosynthesis repressor FlbT [Verrucomicrobiota bacterium]MBT3884494.1 flagellar biosynthesis repressor FlbT [Rhodospirillaceae bacterium]MBT4119088.1 flagellar biosynthesis repressor FlbT [Rhodospirillaceae bacterium]MBT4674802.1 flagellar biosynthesis repressor FlbT [Rhodospirillaceae bacterium]
MPLKLTLKPDEKVLIGTAVLTNAGPKAEIIIQNTVPVLREKDIISEEKADTVVKKIYFVILSMYVDSKNEQKFHDIYFKLVKELFNACPDQVILALVMEVSQKILEGNHYQALKACKKLLKFEAELLANVPG